MYSYTAVNFLHAKTCKLFPDTIDPIPSATVWPTIQNRDSWEKCTGDLSTDASQLYLFRFMVFLLLLMVPFWTVCKCFRRINRCWSGVVIFDPPIEDYTLSKIDSGVWWWPSNCQTVFLVVIPGNDHSVIFFSLSETDILLFYTCIETFYKIVIKKLESSGNLLHLYKFEWCVFIPACVYI